MPLPYVISTSSSATNAPSVAAESGCVWLYHGARQGMINSIVGVGIDEEQAKLAGSKGSFWATKDFWDAFHYSQLPPYDRGDPAILGFQVPTAMLDYLLRQTPPWAIEYFRQGWYQYEFHSQSFPMLNSEMKAVTVFPNVTINVES